MQTTGDRSARERVGTPVDGVEVLGSLSPSRAGDFKACPLLYRYRTIDRLAEFPSEAALRGTVVHKVLEDLFDLSPDTRTPEQAELLLPQAWAAIRAAQPELAEQFADDASSTTWLLSCRRFLRTYFELEDPSGLEPAERELYLETLLDCRLLLRGFVDRIDVAPDGAVRIVDYKTGSAPGPRFEARAMFQLRFYALIYWRSHGLLPAELRLIYLGDGQTLRYSPDEAELRATERLVTALWEAIAQARDCGEWLPRRSAMCGWCSFTEWCPEFGGTPPPLPAVGA